MLPVVLTVVRGPWLWAPNSHADEWFSASCHQTLFWLCKEYFILQAHHTFLCQIKPLTLQLWGIYFLLCFGLLVYKPQHWFDLSIYHLRPGSHSFSYTLNSSMESLTSSESPSQMKTILYVFCCFCQELQRKSQSCVDQHHGTIVNPTLAGPHQCPLMLSPRSRNLPYMFTAMSALKLCQHQSPIPTVLAP